MAILSALSVVTKLGRRNQTSNAPVSIAGGQYSLELSCAAPPLAS